MKKNLSKKIEQYSKEIKDEIISIRRALHQIPELGDDLPKTRSFILNELKKYDVEISENVGNNGIVALLRGKKNGKTIGYRADMDALPILEENICEYKSLHLGKMHACGHDAHMAIALSLIKVFSLIKDEIKGNIKFIFQPAEETIGGAFQMIQDKVLEDPKVDYIFGSHVWPDIESGKIGIRSGGLMAGVDEFEIEIQGKGGHAGIPHKAINPLVVASKIVCELESIKNYFIDSGERVVISICTMEGGKTINVIPHNAKIGGTLRFFSDEVQEIFIDKLHKIVNNISDIYGTSCKINYKKLFPPVINDSDVISTIEDTLKKDNLEDSIFPVENPSMGAEDFSFFLKEVPGAYIFLGTKNISKGIVRSIHNPQFDMDEDIFESATSILSKIILEFLDR